MCCQRTLCISIIFCFLKISGFLFILSNHIFLTGITLLLNDTICFISSKDHLYSRDELCHLIFNIFDTQQFVSVGSFHQNISEFNLFHIIIFFVIGFSPFYHFFACFFVWKFVHISPETKMHIVLFSLAVTFSSASMFIIIILSLPPDDTSQSLVSTD